MGPLNFICPDPMMSFKVSSGIMALIQNKCAQSMPLALQSKYFALWLNEPKCCFL